MPGGQLRGERRRGGRRDDPARGHSPGELTFPPGQAGPQGGQECHQRLGDQHQDGHQPQRRQHQVVERGSVTEGGLLMWVLSSGHCYHTASIRIVRTHPMQLAEPFGPDECPHPDTGPDITHSYGSCSSL